MIIDFYNCKSKKNYNSYVKDLRASGATIVSDKVDYEAEFATITIDTDSREKFLDKFSLTNSYEFSSLA